LNKAEPLFTDGQFSEVFSSQILVDISFLGVKVVLKVELCLEHLSVSISLGDELSQFLDLVIDGSQINSDLSDSSSELSMFSVQVFNSLLKRSLILSLSGGEVIEGVHNGCSEFVQFVHDFTKQSLVREILAGSQSNQSLDQGGVLSVRSDSGFDLSQAMVEFLDLQH
jgi:hypothetical protein